MNLIPLFIKELLISIFPEKISNILYFNLSNIHLYPRLDIWKVSFNAIFTKPFFGWGAATFPLIYYVLRDSRINDIQQHSHNLFLELSINYGLIISFLVFTVIFKIFKDKYKIIFHGNQSNVISKYWFMATFIGLFTQLFDVTYYDIRISLLFWILLAGLDTIKSKEHYS